ncbi:MAG: DNA-binding protein [Acidobacteria bacterium]|nr:DNA-binding protein [Acidobacteriota bacterium]
MPVPDVAPSIDSAEARVLNRAIAAKLDEIAALLASQHANAFRVRAYRRAAAALRRLETPISDVLARGGVEALEALPGIGESLARTIRDLARFGYSPMLDRLRGDADPIRLLSTVPGIGRRLATRLHEDLHIETLETLEAAAHDGRLTTLAGIGPKRLAGIRAVLAERLGRVRPPAAPAGSGPNVEEILDVDREYRDAAASGRLPTIAPRRFNPDHEPWLPILHTRRGTREYTAVFSNTARAHRLDRTRDWVVIHWDDGGSQGQCTVVTERAGPQSGQRVVRGREQDGAVHDAHAIADRGN